MLAASTQTFSMPSLSALIAEAERGTNTAPAAINVVLQSLESQLTSGPLADLTSGAVNSSGFVREVQSLESSYSSGLDGALLPSFPNVDTLLQLQGQRIVADETALNQQNAVGLITSAEFATQAKTAIDALTGGPVYSLSTPLSGYASLTQAFEADLTTLAKSLSSSATTALTPAEVSMTMLAETLAYQTDIHASAQVTHPNVSNIVDQAVTALETTAASIATMTSSAAQSALTTAISTFDSAVLDTNGIFGPSGAIAAAGSAFRGANGR